MFADTTGKPDRSGVKFAMVTVILFSRNRAMQTSAFIDSLTRYSHTPAHAIHVIYRVDEGFCYQRLIKTHPAVNWHEETDLNSQFIRIAEQAEDHILFGVEDVVFTDYFDIRTCIEVLDELPKLFGFSLRLGPNIQGAPAFLRSPLQSPIHQSVLLWDWTKATDNNWSYPWEISASIYRKADVLSMVNRWRSEIFKAGLKPNSLEWQPWLRIKADRENGTVNQPWLACFDRAKSLTLCVNKVSSTSTTWVEEAPGSDLSSLQTAYEGGIELDWQSCYKANNDRIHVGASFFRLRQRP